MHSDSSNSSGMRTKRSRRRLATPNSDSASSSRSLSPVSRRPRDASSGDASSLDDGLNADLMGDSADRERLARMTEKEREEELFKRAERREAMKARAMVKRRMKRKQRGAARSSPPTAAAQDCSSSEEEGEEEEEEEGEEEDSSSASSRRRNRRRPDSKRHESRHSQLAQLMARRKALARKSLLKTSDIYSEDSDSSSSESTPAQVPVKPRRAISSDSDDSSEIDAGREAGSSSWLVQRQEKRPVKRFVDSSVSSELSEEDPAETERRQSRRSARKRRKEEGGRRRRLRMSSEEETRGEKVEEECSSSDEEERQVETRHVETLEELLKIRISRYRLAKWVHMPFFRELVIGMYVRVGIGRQPDAGQPVYRLAEISDVVETSKVYDVEKTRTNKGLILRHAADKAMFRLKFVSNQPFGSAEFGKWTKSMHAANRSTPTLRFVEEKVAAVKKAYHFRLESEKDLDAIVAEKARFLKRPHNYAMHKVQLQKERDLAVQSSDKSKVAQLNEAIEECERRANDLDRRRSANIKALTYINQRNRERNLANAEAALKMEAVEREEMERLHGGDPFTRLKTRPVLFGRHLDKEKEDEKTKASGGKEGRTTESKTARAARAARESAEAAEAVVRTGDFYSIHDFEVGVDIALDKEEALSQATLMPSPAVVKPTEREIRAEPRPRTLNLEEYKRRRNLL